MEWKILKITLDFRCFKIKYVIVSFLYLVGLFLAHTSQCTVIASEWRMYTVNCNHQTGDWKLRMQCQEDTGFCSGKKNLQGLSSTVYSLDFSKHLLFLCSFNNLGCLISFHTELHKSLIYTWIQSPFQICDLQIFFFFIP